jgi:hypothetical protein
LERVSSAIVPARTFYTPEMTAGSLNDLLLQCTDEALTDLLGKRTREAIYDYLERNCSLSRNEIPTHLNKFIELLEETFGKGSRTIAKSIIRRMYEKLEWKFVDIPGYEFVDYLETIRARIARTLIEQAGMKSTR